MESEKSPMSSERQSMESEKRSSERRSSLLDELIRLNVKQGLVQAKAPGKKKKRRVAKPGVAPIPEQKVKTVEEKAKETKEGEKKEGEEVFVYNWRTCACGMDHPPVPNFVEPDGKRCTFYWQVADLFPFMTIYRLLTTEMKFIKADTNKSGLIELPELKKLLQTSIGADKITDSMVNKTFKEADTDESGTLDFVEVLTIVNAMVQREKVNLPMTIQKDYSKVCSIQ